MSQALVAQIKAELEARGVPLAGPCGALQITKRVAWALRSTGAGLLNKPAGNNCESYAVDIVAFPDGGIRDVLGDGGGANIPQWGDLQLVDPARYRPAIDPGDQLPPIDLPPPLPPVTVDLSAVFAEIDGLRARIKTLEDAPAYVLPELHVEGDTSRSWGHAHRVKLIVTPK